MKKLILSHKKIHQIGMRILKWYFNYYFRKRFPPLITAVFTTNLCNLNCNICSIWRSLPKSSISFEQLKEVVDFSAQTACYISFSGGEPLLVADIIRMISYASSKIPYVHLVSNGYLVSLDIVRSLRQANLTEVSLSLDGEAEWHNKTHGSEKSFAALINAIECFKSQAAQIKIVIDTVMYPDALEQTRKAVEISERLGVFHKVQPVNRHFNFVNSSGQPPDLDFSHVNEKELEDLIDYLIKSPHVLNSNYFLKQIPLYFSNNLICKPARPGCRLPYFFLEVSAYGKVSPCMYGTGWDGVFTIGADLKNKLGSKKYKMQQKKLEQCRLCDRSMFMCYWESLIQFPLIHSIVYGIGK